MRLSLAIIFAAILLPFQLAMAGSPDLLAMQKNIEDRLSPVVRSYDPNALIFVRIELKAEKHALPGTPFIVDNLSLQDSNESPQGRRIDVLVLSGMKPFSEKVVQLLEQVSGRLGFKAQVRVDPLPPELTQSAEAESRKFQLEQEEKREAAGQSLRAIMIALFTVSAALLLTGIFMILSRRGSSKELLRTISGGFQKVSEAFENGGGGSQSAQPPRGAQAASASPAAIASSGADSWDYAEEALAACLSDCYWSQADGYAAFLWKRIAAAKKKRVLDLAPGLAEYISAALSSPETDLGAIDEPYYLAPLPLSHLDNQALADCVRKSPALLAQVPALRRSGLPLRAAEVVALRKSPSSASVVFGPRDFELMTPSRKRVLRKRAPISIRDLSEEREILALEGLSVELIAELASLGWLRLLPEPEVSRILSRFSARELASAWIGPEEVLQDLERRLPPKKLETLRSYLSTTPASRDSEAFVAIHAQTVEWLERPQEQAEHAQAA